MGRISILLASLMVVVSTVGSTATAFDYKGACCSSRPIGPASSRPTTASSGATIPPSPTASNKGWTWLEDTTTPAITSSSGSDGIRSDDAWGVIEFEKEMIAASQLKQALGAIRWGTDYFLKAHKAPNTLWVQDELLWAATWLYEATNDQTYLNYVSTNAVAFGGTGWAVKEFYWDNKYAGLQVLLTKVLLQAGSAPYSSVLKQYQAKAEFFICACLQKNTDHDVTMSPGGLLYFDDWNNMQYVSSAGFLLAVYSDYLSASKSNLKCPDGEIQPLDILRFAQSQVDYILGKNPKSISYLVGYGGSSPTHVHHRGASMPSIFAHPAPIRCIEGFENWYNNKSADPNVILGALLGGPDDKDGFSDDRKTYKQTEPTLTGNAPLIGLLARLSCLPDSGR